MEKKLAQEFRNRWDAVAAVEATEQQIASMTLRWKQLNALFQLGMGLGLIQKTDQDDSSIQQRWSRLKGVQR